jgi:uncharacterized DUF497 family protein
MQFEWDEDKAKKNILKHQVSFNEAKTVFDDPFYIDFYDQGIRTRIGERKSEPSGECRCQD